MLELRCPQVKSSEYLCDRTAEYQVDGTIYCKRHARRLMEQQSQKCPTCEGTGKADNQTEYGGTCLTWMGTGTTRT